ncbi:MAG: DNA polymerase III subunit beta [Candidatus Omnitrophica bacterium]|nr:DNA polymerase III subunit beta [Candidatus Omnitrophota bacterium]
MPEFKDKNSVTVPQAVLKKMLSRTSFAMSYDQTRYVLNGILFMIGPATLKLAATDGRRLAVIENQTQIPKEFEKTPPKIIIPTKAIAELLRTLGDVGEARIILDENQVLFNLGHTVIISRLVEGEFPDYARAIPKETKDKLKINREVFLSAVKRANILTSQESQAIKLELLKDKLVISKVTPELGESREEISVGYGGPELVIGFNPVYLIDVLKSLDKQDVMFELTSADKPGAIRAEDGYTYVVLPMQIN